MYHFFVPAENISDSQVVITGGDFNHIKNVLRMKPNEKFIANDGNGASYCCSIREFVGDSVVADIEKGQLESSELPVRLVLFQGLPKADKMELIIQKAVELGAAEIVPVEMVRCEVKAVMNFDDALKYAETLDVLLVPYECADSLKKLRKKIDGLKTGMSAGIFIGPEGGYEEKEIERPTGEIKGRTAIYKE